MISWAVPIGFLIAYLGGGMGIIVYNDAKEQGKKKRGVLYLAGIAVLASVLSTLVVTLIK